MKQGTKEAILDAAEHLFGESGIDATSLRDITQRAGANLAAANYHFGGKEQLVQAVFTRRFAPVGQRRLQLLEQAEAQAGARPPAVEAVLDAFIRPVVEGYTPLMGRLFTENPERAKLLFLDQARATVQRFDRAFARCCPNLDFAARHWAMHFLAGSAIMTLLGEHILAAHSNGKCSPKDRDALTRRLIAHHAPGFKLPKGAAAK